MSIRKFWNSLISAGLCAAIVAPSFVGVALAQDEKSILLARLQNRQKLAAEGQKFESAVNKLKPLASKNTFTEQDIKLVDAFINETDGGEQIAIRAQSKAFAAAQKVSAFENGVKAASKGKNPQEFIASLEENPQLVNKIPGAREASQAFVNSVKSDADILKNVGEKLKEAGKKATSQNYYKQSPQFGFLKASFGADEKSGCQNSEGSLFNTSLDASENSMNFRAQTGVVEAALIALAAAYLGIQVTRLTTGAIGRCINRALRDHRQCIRDERADGNGLSRSERLYCRGEFLLMAYLCVILPI